MQSNTLSGHIIKSTPKTMFNCGLPVRFEKTLNPNVDEQRHSILLFLCNDWADNLKVFRDARIRSLMYKI